jgi:hypothetical protein
MRQFNWTRANEIAGPGTFALTAIILLIMVWPMIKPGIRTDVPPALNNDSQKMEEPRKTNNVPWIMPSILAVAMITAAFLHYKAAQVARSVPNILPPPHSAPTPTPAAAAVTSSHPDRVMVNVTPEHLTSFFQQGHTSIQAERLAEAFIGKWMEISGPLGDVLRVTDTHRMVVIEGRSLYKNNQVYMYFREKEWADRLATLKPGDRVTIVGRIENVVSQSISLGNCELVDS